MTVTITARNLRRPLKAVIHAASREWDRPVLHTVLFTATEGRLYVIAADNFRLARCAVNVGTGDPSEFGERETFIDLDRIDELRALLPHGDALIKVTPEPDRVVFEWDGATFAPEIPKAWGKDGKWPGYLAITGLGQPTPDSVVNPRLMRDAFASAASIGEYLVSVAPGAWNEPVRIEAGPLTEWVMPIRTDAHMGEPATIDAPEPSDVP